MIEESFTDILKQWREDRPDDLDTLEDAHEDDSSPFDWIEFIIRAEKNRQRGCYEIVSRTHDADADEDVRDLSHDFGADWQGAAYDCIRSEQESTQLAPRAFVALVLSETRLTHREAANQMGISTGTFDSKMSREVEAEIESSRSTINVVEKLKDE